MVLQLNVSERRPFSSGPSGAHIDRMYNTYKHFAPPALNIWQTH